ncbi:hypothetical protein DE146DRAFT_790847 [Phaeosphaeria sp. MPI-PUGE-AT-0046c]|nr:hypothetical protein DE146DRAFT_790847 [Phaeosphaeria sp. MPI-PUGE-AT-0046c]
MSYPTKPAFIHVGTWDDRTRAHPVMKWMENYTVEIVDKKVWNDKPSDDYLTSDHKLNKSTGEVVSGGDASFSAMRDEIYAPLAQHFHDPQYLVAWDDGDEHEMIGVASLFYNLAIPGDGNKIKDRNGKSWDGVIPAAFHFRYVKDDEHGYKLSRTAIYNDPTAAVVGMLKRGMMKPEDLMK